MSENKPNDDPKLSTTDRVVKCKYICTAIAGSRDVIALCFKDGNILGPAVLVSAREYSRWSFRTVWYTENEKRLHGGKGC